MPTGVHDGRHDAVDEGEHADLTSIDVTAVELHVERDDRTVYKDPAATLDDLREAVNTLGETEQTARRVLGGANPLAINIERALRYSREALSDRDASSISDAFAAMTPPG